MYNIKVIMFLGNIVCEKWTKLLLETVHSNPTSSLVIMLRQIFEKNLSDQSFISSHVDLIFNTMECLIRTYLEKTLNGDCKNQHELCQTWKLVIKNMLDTHEDEVVKRCSLEVANYVKTNGASIEHVENAVDQFVEEYLSCTQKIDLPVKFFFELLRFANSSDHSKAITCCELASFIDGSLFYTGSNVDFAEMSGEYFNTVYALYSQMYVFTKQILKFLTESEQISDQPLGLNEEFISFMTNTLGNVNVIADLLKYFSNVCIIYAIHKYEITFCSLMFLIKLMIISYFRENIAVKLRVLFLKTLKPQWLYFYSPNKKM